MVAHSSSKPPLIVIGTGPAGAAAALFASSAGVETLMLESGSARAALGFNMRLNGITVARKKPPLRQRADITHVGNALAEIYEELAPGGLSNHWSCAVPRFSPEDFLDAQRAGEEHTWPIGYDDVAPWYARVEALLHVAGASEDLPGLPHGCVEHEWKLAPEWHAVRRAAASRFRSLTVMPYANGAETMFTRSGTAFNAYAQMIRPAVGRGQLRVRYDAHVLRLEWSEVDKQVVAVNFHDRRSGREERIACRGVIVAAGAINSAQILLQSLSKDFPGGLGNTHDVLGRYLHDHPLGKLVLDLSRDVHIHPASYMTRPRFEHATPLYAAAFMQWCGTASLVRSTLEGRPGRSRRIGFSVFGTMAPSREDRVWIDSAACSESGDAKLRVRLTHPPEALRTLEHARDDMVAILSDAGWDPRVHVWHVEAPGNSVHYGGTCRMHARPQFGVVDANCRVHGVPNVAVADSGVFTTGPEKNPVLTAMALAARAAASLAEAIGA